MRMKLSSFKHNFHDAHLASFSLGPRRELVLETSLDPVWNRDTPRLSSVRFGGIENFDEVASFFRALPLPPNAATYIAEIIGIQCLGDEPNWFVVELAGHGLIRIQSHHVTET